MTIKKTTEVVDLLTTEHPAAKTYQEKVAAWEKARAMIKAELEKNRIRDPKALNFYFYHLSQFHNPDEILDFAQRIVRTIQDIHSIDGPATKVLKGVKKRIKRLGESLGITEHKNAS